MTQRKVNQTLNASGASQAVSDNNSQLEKPKVTDPIEEKNPKESEKEDLQIALGMFLEERISRNDLLDLCEVYARCQEDSVVLEFPETLLSDYCFQRKYLSSEEVKAQLRWTLKIAKRAVTSDPELPVQMSAIALELVKRILEKKEIEFIDKEFRELGFNVSETRDNAALRTEVGKLLCHDTHISAPIRAMDDALRAKDVRFNCERDS